MRSKNATRTQAQKDWQSDLANMGCLVSGFGEAEIDHLFGAMAKSNGVNIGQWAVIPLNDGPHRNWKNNRTNQELKFIDSYCNNGDIWDTRAGYKKELFLACCCRYLSYYKRKDLPFDNDVLLGIMSYV